ncbi:NAD(P)/FAD-dependent oxidoreductase [Flammeovirga sp. SJP92]|uniref:NAD(P)/FAD-dependent oxidoreductase n=1 Tax=Flammeovirga sp. SJP92 TaxID=1775430 RepID=UPI0007886192|nr:NAD(P)/FAD-dependent oxidoreductase [Flammeovirga sp. SJP92]KXX71703.1 pyridine nucleotide-disulfide oxidoreductase [Flammeovirga sp. SJP92]
MKQTDVLIIGAGPSGSIAGSILLQNGFNVTIIEKEQFPRFVIGESLIPKVMQHLDKAGLLEALDAQNFEKKYGARFFKGEKVCHFSFAEKFTDGWEWTWQMPRADFDYTIAKEVEKKGAEVLYQHAVTNVDFSTESVITSIEDKNGNTSQIASKYIIDGSGYGRVLPRLLDLSKPSDLPPRGSFFTHVEDINRPDTIDGTTITFDILDKDLWFWVIPFSNGKTSLGFVGDTRFFEGITDDNKAEKFNELIQQSEYYKARFSNLEYEFEPMSKIGYSVGVKQLFGDRYVLTGNSTEFLDPVFSSGVSFAAESSALAAELVAKTLKGENVDWQKDYSDYILRGVEVFKSYIKYWYDGSLQDLFFSDEINFEFKKQITSILAGYVWDKDNRFVNRHKTIVKTINHFQKEAQSM